MRKLQVLAMAGMLTFGITSTASATTEEILQEQIEQVLANTEGGVQISMNEIAWEGGEVIMSFPMPGEDQAPASSPAAQRLQAKVAGESARPVEPVLDQETAEVTDNCPTQIFGNDWYCFYQNSNFGGRRLQWNATHRSPVYFSKYDFDNEVSSWSNKGGKKITVYEDFWTSGPTWLWSEYAHSRDTYVGGTADNRADYFITS
ncbi:peptidase inhibitor family I36 protein [Streptomyces sp. NPDC057565]|uniref:peptidase inhibitor family I36 protein n=1 Tax=Streptomyces sp. NPDC057565 TaxID=3346169 RepID=UPI00368AB449